VTFLFYLGGFLCAVLIILWGCSVFTNAVEWLGKRTSTSEGAVGSIYAALGTTLPETAIPVSAFFLTAGPPKIDVGMGAILGAPFTDEYTYFANPGDLATGVLSIRQTSTNLQAECPFGTNRSALFPSSI
jgi:hypothetical protein